MPSDAVLNLEIGIAGLDPAGSAPPRLARQVISGLEYQEIEVPLDLLMVDKRLDLYEGIVNRNFFQIQLSGSSLIFRAGGFIGLIPLNDHIYIEVQSRVPIANLERLLLSSEGYLPTVLTTHERSYKTGSTPTPSLIDMLADRFMDSLEQIRYEGLHFEYRNTVREAQSAVGRISAFGSATAQRKTGDPFRLVPSSFQRTFDNDPNRCLRMAVHLLLNLYRNMQRKGAKAALSRLSQLDRLLENVTLDYSLNCLESPLLQDDSLLPEQRSSYPKALSFARSLLAGRGLVLRSQSGEVTSSSVLISMEKVFERYVRDLIRRNFQNSTEIRILDGNQTGESGGAIRLFTDPNSLVLNTLATPNIVISGRESHHRPAMIIDAKYKPCPGQPDRDDINQVLSYGLAYRANKVGLLYPHLIEGEPRSVRLGSVGGVEVFKLAVDLGNSDLDQEETAFAKTISGLVGR